MKPTHPKALDYATSGLFDGLSTFHDLEQRIASLETPQEEGAAFEVFVEAYLATQSLYQANAIWTKTVPLAIRTQLHLPPSDEGYDGVFQRMDGTYVVYQAKFRTHRASLSWTELSTFIGITDSAPLRFLFTNTDMVAKTARTRLRFQRVCGHHFGDLEAEDFSRLHTWLQAGPVRDIVKSPYPHNQRAIEAITAHWQKHVRGQVLMACGTGKTLVGLWSAEQLAPERVLVLVPSLLLLKQILFEWTRNTHWKERFQYICVCSDPSVSLEADAIRVDPSEVGFRVDTDPGEVRRFLTLPSQAVKVVFATYHSAKVVAEGSKGLPPFDLGIFDEAHKTAGRVGTRYSLALRDDQLPITKRLFLTATPRHYDVSRRTKEGDHPAVFSMDDETTFGPVAHRLSFAKAAAEDIICSYTILISVIDHETITNELLNRGEVIVEDDPVWAKHVAGQIALRQAVESYPIKRIITFHTRVGAAKEFVGDGPEGVGPYLPDFSLLHVNGAQDSGERDAILREFAQANKGLVTNARCLTEGVNVPAVDMVAFLSPKKSKVDIAQAVGRAMRKAGPDKTTGYVLVPLYLERQTGETIEQSMARSNFEEVANVLNAMKEQDDDLVEIIRQMREHKGRKGHYRNDFGGRIRILGPLLDFDVIQEAIIVELVERLGVTWDERYGQLAAFKENHGHSIVPQKWSENQELATWVSVQRGAYKTGKLSEERIARLNALGFDWDPWATAWQTLYQALVTFQQTQGHCNVPIGWSENQELAIWVHIQRGAYKTGNMSEERVTQLEALGFEWEVHTAYWQTMYQVLVTFQQTQGHCNVPQRWSENQALGRWVRKQREARERGCLHATQISQLDALGFDWDPIATYWETMYRALVAFKENKGHCNVPNRWSENQAPANWVGVQRRAYKTGNLSEERVARLEKLGFVWDPNTASWETMYRALVAFKENKGHCNVPNRWSENQALATWVAELRTVYRKRRLSEERVARLEKLEFVWDLIIANWETMYRALVAFKRTQGHCNVPRGWSENPKLGNWVSVQRVAYKTGNLSKERVAQLEALGIEWVRIRPYY